MTSSAPAGVNRQKTKDLVSIAVFLTVGILGGKRGTAAVAVYMLLGIVGLPVFAGFKGGIGVLLGSTGGYIIGFLGSALVMWAFEHVCGRQKWSLPLSMAAGLLVCYAFGTAWFMAVYASTTGAIGLLSVLGMCVFPFVIPDLVKIGLALLLTKRLKPALRNMSASA